MRSYNYTMVEKYKQKIYIPILRIEVVGWLPIIAGGIGAGTITIVLGTIFQLFIGESNSYLYAFLVAFITLFLGISYTNEKNNETGRNKIKEFYYTKIKSYRSVYDKDFQKHYLSKKKKGEMWYVHQ